MSPKGLVISFGEGGGEGFREGSRCFQGGKGRGSVITDRVQSGTVEN